METFTPASSFETNLNFENRNSFRDASFSSYLNKSEENIILKLTNSTLYGGGRKEDDDEIGVFGAEKYFNGEMVEEEEAENEKDLRFLDKVHDQKKKKDEEFDENFAVKQRIDGEKTRTPSVRSMSSFHSRSGLLPPRNQARKPEKGSKTRIFLNLGCNCIDQKSTEIKEKRFIHGHGKEILKPPPMKQSDFDQKTETISSNWARMDLRDDYFSFPVLNSKNLTPNSNLENLAGKVLGDNNGGLSLGRKIDLLTNWDDDMYIPSSEMYNKDVDSDASSDLFEIESFSTTGNSSFFAHKTSESNCYAPSEVSIEWSVATASAADFSVASDYEEVRTRGGGGGGAGRSSGGVKEKYKKRPGILSGCKSQKSVRVAGDEYRVLGGETAVGGGGMGGTRRRQSDSAVVGSRFLGENNNEGGFDRRRGHYGSDMCSVSGSRGLRASRLLYIQH